MKKHNSSWNKKYVLKRFYPAEKRFSNACLGSGSGCMAGGRETPSADDLMDSMPC
jgi:hypothetical protein